MTVSGVLRRLMGVAARRPGLVVAVMAALAIGGGLLALRLSPSADTSTLVGKGSDSFKATERYHRDFGDDAILVLVKQPLKYTTLTADLERVLGLEGCISGNVPQGKIPRGGTKGPCGRLAVNKPVKVVFGPGTFLNESVGQIADEFNREKTRQSERGNAARQAAIQLAKARGLSKAQQKKLGDQAASLVYNEFVRNVLQIALRYGLSANSQPQLNNPQFISQIVFDPKKADLTPKARFAYIFPTKDSALIQVRLRPDLSEKEKREAIANIRKAVAMPDWQLPNGKGRYVVTGAPVVVADLSDSITGSIGMLILAALIVMAITLGVVFRSRARLLPLIVALVAVGITFGALSLAGASLTMASVGVLPVLIGLAVDYAIQLQARLTESGRSVREAVEDVAARGGPTVVTAAAATAAGFLVLVLSPVPMVRGFGLLLVGGIAVALLCAVTLGTAGLALAERWSPRGVVAGASRGVGSAWRGAGELLTDNRFARGVSGRASSWGRAALGASTRRPTRVLGIALAVAAIGWVVDTQATVESDVQKLVPQNLSALQDLQQLQRSTGVGGEIDVMVNSDNLTDPAVVRWMTSYQADLLKRFGYTAKRGCGKAELCPAFSLPDLFGGARSGQTQAQIKQLLDSVPPYFSQGVITGDRHTATLAFGIRLMPLKRQQEVIQAMRDRLKPPPGVTAEVAGLPVLAAEANAAVSSPWRRMLTLLAGLLAVAAVLFVAFRDWQRALVPLIPIALATGWSALILFLVRIPLNPMSVTLGALVIAISTEFSVLLAERFRSERAAGHEAGEALQRTYRSTGAAVLASGTTAIAGFAVLVLSDIRMLRDFGAVTVVDLGVSLLGVLVVLPAVLLLAERGELIGLPARALRRIRPRPRARPGRAPAG